MTPGAIMDIAQPEMVTEIAGTLGIPLFLLTFIGVWKILGILALSRPNFEGLNEWAYAGFFFDLTGAAYWHGAGGDLPGVLPPLMLAGLLMVSYKLRDSAREEAVARPV